jgi:hypothetical protein
VLAVEPDADVARIVESKGISVELARFEDWNPAGRTFDRRDGGGKVCTAAENDGRSGDRQEDG